MKKFFTYIISWFSEGDRLCRFIIGLILGLVFGFATGIMSAFISEYDAWYYNGRFLNLSLWDKIGGWNWAEFSAMMLGSVIGGAIHLFLF